MKIALVYDRLITGLATTAGLIIAATGLLIVYDVIARNLGWQPPASTVALTEYAMLYFTMAAAPWLVRKRGHIIVEVVYQRLPDDAQHRVDRLILALCAMVALAIAFIAGMLLIEAVENGEIEIRSLAAPRWVLFAPLIGGFGLMAIEFLRLLIRGESLFASQAKRGDSL